MSSTESDPRQARSTGAGLNDNDQGGDPAADLDQLRQDLATAQDRALRAQADLDNYRKRMRREMDEERRYAYLPLLRDLLPVLDNIALATKAAENSPEAAGLLTGVKMVAEQLEGVLQRHHCRRIDAQLGSPFDPSLHEAIGTRPSGDHPPHTVLEVTRAGYQMHDRVVRPAQVVVSTAAAPDKPG